MQTPSFILRTSLLLSSAALFLAGPVAWAADQPQWGEALTRNMISPEKGLPESFDLQTGKNILWTAALGTQTYSTPVVARGKVLIATNNENPRDPRQKGDRGVLMCFDEKDGKFLWQLVVPKLTEDIYLDWPRVGMVSTASVDGDRAYHVTNRGEVVCLDLNGMANGNDGPFQDEGKHMVPPGTPALEAGPTDADIVWLYDIIAGVGIHQHDSAHASPLVHGRFLYVNSSNGVDNTHCKIRSPDAPSLIVLDKATGRLLAQDAERIGPRVIHCTWSSPALGEVNDRPLVFFAGGDGVVYAFEALQGEPASGEVQKLKKVWQFDGDPAAPKENVHQWQDNRKEGPSNISSMPVFYKNRVYVTGSGDYWHGKPLAWLKCIDATKTGDITKSGELWSYPLHRFSMSTPSICDGLLFVADCGKTIHCLDAESGQCYWTHETKGEVWGSTLVADGKLYTTTRKGEICVLAASKEKKLLGMTEIPGPINSSPVVANGVLYIANMTTLYAIKNGR